MFTSNACKELNNDIYHNKREIAPSPFLTSHILLGVSYELTHPVNIALSWNFLMRLYHIFKSQLATIVLKFAYVTVSINSYKSDLELWFPNSICTVTSLLLFKQRVFTFGKGRSEGNKAMKSLVSILCLFTFLKKNNMETQFSFSLLCSY